MRLGPCLLISSSVCCCLGWTHAFAPRRQHYAPSFALPHMNARRYPHHHHHRQPTISPPVVLNALPEITTTMAMMMDGPNFDLGSAAMDQVQSMLLLLSSSSSPSSIWLSDAASATADVMNNFVTTTTTTSLDVDASILDTTTTMATGWSPMDADIGTLVTTPDRVFENALSLEALSPNAVASTSGTTMEPTTSDWLSKDYSLSSPTAMTAIISTTTSTTLDMSSSAVDTTTSSTGWSLMDTVPSTSVAAQDMADRVDIDINIDDDDEDRVGWLSGAKAVTADVLNAIISTSSDAAADAMDAAADVMDAAVDVAADVMDAAVDAAADVMDAAVAAASSLIDGSGSTTTTTTSSAVTPDVVIPTTPATTTTTTVPEASVAVKQAISGGGGGWWQAYVDSFKTTLITVHNGVDPLLRRIGITQTWGISIALFTAGLHALLYPLSIQPSMSAEYIKSLDVYKKEIRVKFQDDPAMQKRAISLLTKDATQYPWATYLITLAQLPNFLGLCLGVHLLTMEGQLQEPFLWIPSLQGPILAPTFVDGMDWLTQGWTRDPISNFPFPSLGWKTTLAFVTMPMLLVMGQAITMQVLQPHMEDDTMTAEERDSLEKVQILLKILLVVIAYVSLQIPAALTIYWFTSITCALVQSLVAQDYYAANPPKLTLPSNWDNVDEVATMVAEERSQMPELATTIGRSLKDLMNALQRNEA